MLWRESSDGLTGSWKQSCVQMKPYLRGLAFLQPISLRAGHGLSEKLERVCTSLGVRAAFKPVRTLKKTLMRLKTQIPEERKRGVVCKVPCKECSKTYVGETKRTLKVRLGEHKQAVKRGDPRNGIAVHAHVTQHEIDWNGAEVKKMEVNYWKRRPSKPSK